MKTPNLDLRSSWVSRLLITAALAAGCGTSTSASPTSLEVEDNSEALSEDELDCERTKRECLIAANCEVDPRAACEEAFRACEEPARAEKRQVHDACRAEREACDETAADDAGRHVCHMAEHKCNAPVEPPDAQCHVDAEECVWTARGGAAPTMPPSDAEEACRDKERACHEMFHMDPEDLPKPPKCEPPPPAACEPVEEPAEPPAPLPVDDDCELTKRECLIAADCDKDLNEACETAFRACEEPARAERDRVRDECRTAREACEAAATNEEGRHSCHIAEHECKLPIEPPEAVCRIDAEKCLWAAKDGVEPPVMTDPPTPHEPSAAEEDCRETERTCREAMKAPKVELPKAPKCGPKPAHCGPGMHGPGMPGAGTGPGPDRGPGAGGPGPEMPKPPVAPEASAP
ncbi:MAG TPA: hypothetical protein VFN67_16405 [Polyangiales bacterium]|nr:hypothetical protein [Polyangiales bacterium]